MGAGKGAGFIAENVFAWWFFAVSLSHETNRVSIWRMWCIHDGIFAEKIQAHIGIGRTCVREAGLAPPSTSSRPLDPNEPSIATRPSAKSNALHRTKYISGSALMGKRPECYPYRNLSSSLFSLSSLYTCERAREAGVNYLAVGSEETLLRVR